METLDLSAWVGKPPEKPATPETPPELPLEAFTKRANVLEDESTADDAESVQDEQTGSSPSDESSDAGDIMHHDDDNSERTLRAKNALIEGMSTDDDFQSLHNATQSIGLFQKHFFIDVPKLSEEDKATYEYLPGHFSVARVLSQQRDKRYIVQLDSGERDIVSSLTFTLLFSCLIPLPPFTFYVYIPLSLS